MDRSCDGQPLESMEDLLRTGVVWLVSFVLGLVVGGVAGVGAIFPTLLALEIVPHGPGYGNRCALVLLGFIVVVGCGAVAAWLAVAPLSLIAAGFVRGGVTGAWLMFTFVAAWFALQAGMSGGEG